MIINKYCSIWSSRGGDYDNYYL